LASAQRTQAVTEGTDTTAVRRADSGVEDDERSPSPRAARVAVGLLVVAVALAALGDEGAGFVPRVATLDALAGLAIGAFVVDRLLTFVPPVGAAPERKQRATDLAVLRLGYGAFVAALFVVLTDLRAVQALAPGSPGIDPGVDRVIAVLAIAGGAAGLARLLSGINPQPPTDATKQPKQAAGAGQGGREAQAVEGTLPPPSRQARMVGSVLLAVGALLALTALGDEVGVNLVGPEPRPDDGGAAPAGDGAVALVVRFGLVLVAAAIVEQAVEWTGRALGGVRLGGRRLLPKHDRGLVLGGLAVFLGVLLARVLDLYLLHNVGFFGVGPEDTLERGLQDSSGLAHWGDAFVTGLVIAAGTKPIHDLSSRLRKAKPKAEAA